MTRFPQLGISDFSRGFHTFGYRWGPDFMVWSVDGVDFHSINTNRNWCEGPQCPYTRNGQPWDKRFHMILNLAVGGNYLEGPFGDDHLRWEHNELVIDSVRVFRDTGTSPPGGSCTPSGSDPWASGNFLGCCSGLRECLNNWNGDGNWYYLCLSPQNCPN